MLSTMYPYLLDQVDQHVPLTTVLDWTRQEVLNEARVSRLIKRGNDILQKEVGLFQLVTPKQMRLREFELVQLVLFHHVDTEHVQ